MAVSHKHPKSNLAIAHEQSAKARICKTAPTKHTSIILYLRYEQQQASKIGSLYPSKGFLLYIRDIVKITKVTNIN